jgi:beta-glucuronidase
LSATPKTYIDDITINTTSVSDSEGTVSYSVELGGSKIAAYSVIAEVYDSRDRLVAQSKGLTGEIRVTNPNLWWPRGMNESVGYLYTLKVLSYKYLFVFFLFFYFFYLNTTFFAPNLYFISCNPQKIQLWNDAKNVEGDVYRLPFGIRFIQWNSTGVYLNGKSVYFKGFGRHEDASVNF